MSYSARLQQRGDVRVYEYPVDPHVPPVVLARVGQECLSEHGQIHHFPALWCDQAAGVVYVIALGATIDPDTVESTEHGLTVFFDPDALSDDAGASIPWLTWRSHPLLRLFLHEGDGGLLRLQIPDTARPGFDEALESMASELATRRAGHRDAVLTHLTLLLIGLVRVAERVGELPAGGDPLLTQVFATIERRYTEPLSLSDVADDVAVPPGYLTTVIRRTTGRTVLEWITKRRMDESRLLLSRTRLSVTDIACRVGLPDSGYFTRLFRRAHGMTPTAWRDETAPARADAGQRREHR